MRPISYFNRPFSAGFTLLEMVVVLAIIGLIVGLVVSKAGGIFGNSQQSVARIFVQDSMSLPLTRYRIDTGDYPSTVAGLNALLAAPASGTERWKGPYLDTPGGRLPVDPWGEPYQYRCPGTKNPSGYDLYSKGPDKLPDTADDIGNW